MEKKIFDNMSMDIFKDWDAHLLRAFIEYCWTLGEVPDAARARFYKENFYDRGII
jgi:hypothetical protein